MQELTTFAKLAGELLISGWAGVAILILLSIIFGIGKLWSKKKWQTETRKQNIEHREKIEAENPEKNRKAEAEHGESEDLIEDFIYRRDQ